MPVEDVTAAPAVSYIVVWRARARTSAFAVGPFPSQKEAVAYAKVHYSFPQAWRVTELRAPEKA